MDEFEYRDEIESLAVNIIDEHDLDESENILSEIVWETVDSHQWIIYFSYNIDVLKYAENEPEDWRSLVGDDASWREVIQIMAYSAMEQDLYFAVEDQFEEVV